MRGSPIPVGFLGRLIHNAIRIPFDANITFYYVASSPYQYLKTQYLKLPTGLLESMFPNNDLAINSIVTTMLVHDQQGK